MGSITVRKLDEILKSKLRIRAARHGRSMEEEVREILRVAIAVEPSEQKGLGQAIRQRIEPLGGIALELPKREAVRPPPRLKK